MKDFTLDTFQTRLRHTIEMAVDARCAPGDVAVVLREEASRLSEDGYAVGGSNDYVYELPNDDPAIDTHDVLAQVIAGSFGGATVRFHDQELRHPGHERWASLWSSTTSRAETSSSGSMRGRFARQGNSRVI